MVAQNVFIAEVESSAQWDSAAEDVLSLLRSLSQPSERDAAQLQSMLEIIDRLFANTEQETRRLKSFVSSERSTDELDLSPESDVALLEHARRFLDYGATYRQRIKLLHRWRQMLVSVSAGSSGRHQVKSRDDKLSELMSLYETLEHSLCGWSDQLCGEYTRRHPELSPSSIETVELGIGDSAALPEVL